MLVQRSGLSGTTTSVEQQAAVALAGPAGTHTTSGSVDSGQSMLRPVSTAMSLVFHKTRVHIGRVLSLASPEVSVAVVSRRRARLRGRRRGGAVCGVRPVRRRPRPAAGSSCAVVAGGEASTSRAWPGCAATCPRATRSRDLVGRVAPLAFWGFGPQWMADPPQCGALADPAVDAATVRGWSASGPGGIVYAVVVDSARGDATVGGGSGGVRRSLGRVRPLDLDRRTHQRHRGDGRVARHRRRDDRRHGAPTPPPSSRAAPKPIRTQTPSPRTWTGTSPTSPS